MKKGKVIALALAAGITFMGAGYAAWTDSVNVETVVKTGKLEIGITEKNMYTDILLSNEDLALDDTRVDENGNYERIELKKDDNGHYLKDSQGYYNSEDNGYNINFKMKLDGKKLTYNFDNLFPGVTAASYFGIENQGSVPAKIKQVNVKIKGRNAGGEFVDMEKLDTADKELYSNMTASYRFYLKNANGDNVKDEDGKDIVYNFIGVKLEKLGENLTNVFKKTNIQPGWKLTSGEKGRKEFWLKVPANLTGDIGEDEALKISIEFTFIQSNLN